ncbi:MAG: hypothetical protein NVS2B8_10610 [Vulcanimicrobiaceae bacterium]
MLCASALLIGCKEPPAAAADAKIGTTFVRGGQNVEIKEIRTYGTSDAVAGANDIYYVVRFVWTNATGLALVPAIDHFVIEDNDKRRFLGVQSGSAALVGISNYSGRLDRGEAHEYTVGFRVPQSTQGILFYDASF